MLLLTFLAGAFQWLLGVLRVGSLVNFVSHSVMLGFTLGAALLIVLGQLPYLRPGRERGGRSAGNGWRLLARFAEFDGPSLLVGGFSFALSLLVRRLRPRWPALLLGLLGGATLVWALPGTFASVAHVQALSSALPGWNPLVFDSRSILDLLPAAVACGMLGLVTSLSIARALAARQETRSMPTRRSAPRACRTCSGLGCRRACRRVPSPAPGSIWKPVRAPRWRVRFRRSGWFCWPCSVRA